MANGFTESPAPGQRRELVDALLVRYARSMKSAIKTTLRRWLPRRARDMLLRLGRPQRFIEVAGPPTYNSDGLASWHNCEFIADPRFAAAYAAGERTGSWKDSNIRWRAHVACWSADQVRSLDGDFVECGVNRGGLSRAVMEYVEFKRSSRKFFLLDTFRGLDESKLLPEERARGFTGSMGGYYDECYSDVVNTFREFSNVKIIRGSVPETLGEVDSTKVCWLSIDMNCVEPEIAAAEFFWDKLVPGAIVVLDDYGWMNHILQKHAFDAFAERKGVRVLSLPTGQGIMIKPQ